MTENEAKAVIKRLIGISASERIVRAVNMAAEALEEIQKYREIGTVEECREARERQRMKKIKNRKLLRDFCNRPYSVRGDCPNCGNIGLLSINTDYCNACGQHLDWSDSP